HVRSAVLRDAQSQSPLDPGLFLNAGMPERFHMNKISAPPSCQPASCSTSSLITHPPVITSANYRISIK
ncbi:hypothetical protein GDO81_017917, partial [Engystomops pustulosus]